MRIVYAATLVSTFLLWGLRGLTLLQTYTTWGYNTISIFYYMGFLAIPPLAALLVAAAVQWLGREIQR